MNQVVVSTIGGASLGTTYALIGLGLVLAYRATGTFNFAHGEFMLLPAYLVGKWHTEGFLSFPLEIVIALAVVAVVAAIFNYGILQPIAGTHHMNGVIATLGFAAVLDGAMALEFGSNQYAITFGALPKGSVSILGSAISSSSLVLGALALIVALLVTLALRLTHIGTLVRAAGQDPALASLGGIPVRVLHTASWAAAGALAGLAGISYGSTSIVNSSMTNVALAAFPAILLGGLDSVGGAIVGGLIIGVVQGFTATYLGGQSVDVITYTILLGVLLLYPRGLFGTASAVRV